MSHMVSGVPVVFVPTFTVNTSLRFTSVDVGGVRKDWVGEVGFDWLILRSAAST